MAVNDKASVKKVLADKRISKLFKMLESGVYAINTKELIDEIQTLNQSRKFRNIKTDEFLASAQRRAIDWGLENSSYRSRAVTIKLRVFKIKRLLDEHLKKTRNYISSQYNSSLQHDFGSTITAKNKAVDYILEPFSTLHHKLETVILMCDILIEDIDASGWVLKNVIEVLKLDHSKNNA